MRGIRKASDFLMALQLTGAAKHSSLANLQVRLPAGVIGAGLTAIDTATELLAYYPVQVERVLRRYEVLSKRYEERSVRARYDEEELLILDEFLAHGRAIRAERSRAIAAGEIAEFPAVTTGMGRRDVILPQGLRDAPAYRQNHEEIEKALEEGIACAEGMSPSGAIGDGFGHLRAVRFEHLSPKDGSWIAADDEIDVPLRSLFIAAGTSPNTIYESEHAGSFEMDAKARFYQRHEPNGERSG